MIITYVENNRNIDMSYANKKIFGKDSFFFINLKQVVENNIMLLERRKSPAISEKQLII